MKLIQLFSVVTLLTLWSAASCQAVTIAPPVDGDRIDVDTEGAFKEC